MINGVARCLAGASSPAEAADAVAAYLRRLGYQLDDDVPLWLALVAEKGHRKRQPYTLTARRIMRHVYATAGWPPALMPEQSPL